MKKIQHYILLFILLLPSMVITPSCNKNKDDKSINIFSIEDDKTLGAQVAQEIENNPDQYPILDPATYDEAYDHIRRIRDEILNSGKVFYNDEFVWDVKIIHDDETLNAFAAPGGYIYVYTGLIKFLENEAQLAGVLAHEIAHADRRHVTDQLTKQYGLSVLLGIVLGDDPGTLANIAAGLVGLRFSRNDEAEADEYSVIYLCPTEYEADGAAGFFEKIEAQGTTDVPEFLSTHPNPDNRISAIHNKEAALGCTGDEVFDARYQDLINSLPN